MKKIKDLYKKFWLGEYGVIDSKVALFDFEQDWEEIKPFANQLIAQTRKQTVEGIKKILEGKGFIGYKDLEEMYEK